MMRSSSININQTDEIIFNRNDDEMSQIIFNKEKEEIKVFGLFIKIKKKRRRRRRRMKDKDDDTVVESNETYREAIEFMFSAPDAGMGAVFEDKNNTEGMKRIKDLRIKVFGEWMAHHASNMGYNAWITESVSVYHIAGTKGKGSVSSFLSSCLSASSIKTVRFLFLSQSSLSLLNSLSLSLSLELSFSLSRTLS